MKKHGLSLVEVLIVSFVLLTLAAILSSAVFRSFTASKRTTCTTQLRTIGTALIVYASDHDDYWPPYRWQSFAWEPQTALFKSTLVTYGVTDSTWFCPLDRHAKTSYRDIFGDHTESSYAMNIWFYLSHQSDSGAMAFKTSAIAKPSSTPAFFDNGSTFEREDRSQYYEGNHGTGGNVLFLDGHVKQVPDLLEFSPGGGPYN